MEIKRLLASSLAVLFSLSCSNVYGVKKFRNLKSTPKNRLCDLCGTLYNKNKKEGTGIGALVERQMHAGCRYRCTANLCGECFDNYCKMFVGDIFLVSDSSNNGRYMNAGDLPFVQKLVQKAYDDLMAHVKDTRKF